MSVFRLAQPFLVFDVETVPDVAGIRRIEDADDEMNDAQLLAWRMQEQRTQKGNEFLPHYLHRVVVISCFFCSAHGEKMVLHSFDAEHPEQEGEAIQAFFDRIDSHEPTLVSWNGKGFDMPVLHYRGLLHGAVAERYFDVGDALPGKERIGRYGNHYLNRFSPMHTDMMDWIALYQVSARAPLDALSRLLGLPGKGDMSGEKVHDAVLEGRFDQVRDYCESDVLNTALLYLRFLRLRGHIGKLEEQAARQTMATSLKKQAEQMQSSKHLQPFMSLA